MSRNKAITLQKTSRAADFILEITADPRGCTQGTIQHCQSDQSQDFRSFLELVMLMEDALTKGDGTQEKMEFQEWQDQEGVS